MIVMIDVESGHEDEFNRWYDQEHLPERAAIPGVLSARRFKALKGNPKYLAVYELENPDVLKSPAYRSVYDPKAGVVSAWSRKMEPHLQKLIKNIYVEITATSD